MILYLFTSLKPDSDLLYVYSNIFLCVISSQIIGVSIVYSTVYWGADQRKHQSSASLAFVRGIHRWPVNSPHKGLVTRKIFTFDDVIMSNADLIEQGLHTLLQKRDKTSGYTLVILRTRRVIFRTYGRALWLILRADCTQPMTDGVTK